MVRAFSGCADVAVTGARDRPVPAGVGSAIYRIAQEALTNVAKHADASHVSVIVEQPEGEVRLIVEDDGRGFSVDAQSSARKPSTGSAWPACMSGPPWSEVA